MTPTKVILLALAILALSAFLGANYAKADQDKGGASSRVVAYPVEGIELQPAAGYKVVQGQALNPFYLNGDIK